jgi:hypothetical protein
MHSCALALLVGLSMAGSAAFTQGVTSDVCPEKLLRIAQLTSELLTEEAAVQRLTAALQDQANRRQVIDTLSDWSEKVAWAANEKPAYAPLVQVSRSLNIVRSTIEGKPERFLRQELAKRQEKAARLARDVALEESLAARCIQEAGAAAAAADARAAAAKPPLSSLTGPYNSPYGHTDLTQSGSQVNGTVKYDVTAEFPRGGTSTLTGTSFDGRIWKFSWRNTHGRYGNGQLSVLPDGTGLKGWWIDESMQPPKKADWWLYRK